MYCNKCGKEIKENSPFCPYCGEKNEIQEKTKPKNILKYFNNPIIILAIIVLIVLILSVIILSSNHKSVSTIKTATDNEQENNFTESKIEYGDSTDNTEKINIEPDISLIEKQFGLSYNSLEEQISSYNISIATSSKYNVNNKILQVPQGGCIYIVYNKTNGKIIYTRNYGQFAGTEIIWMDYEAESSMAKYEGHSEETTIYALIIRAKNASQYLIDNRSNSTFSTMEKYIEAKLSSNSEYETEATKDYEIIKYKWSKNSETNEIEISIESKTNNK